MSRIAHGRLRRRQHGLEGRDERPGGVPRQVGRRTLGLRGLGHRSVVEPGHNLCRQSLAQHCSIPAHGVAQAPEQQRSGLRGVPVQRAGRHLCEGELEHTLCGGGVRKFRRELLARLLQCLGEWKFGELEQRQGACRVRGPQQHPLEELGALLWRPRGGEFASCRAQQGTPRLRCSIDGRPELQHGIGSRCSTYLLGPTRGKREGEPQNDLGLSQHVLAETSGARGCELPTNALERCPSRLMPSNGISHETCPSRECTLCSRADLNK
mmetsp:Transcript_45607/g.146362  ORF Transcript_45607/g.146362 Transcript_45607/m.146362 type:complete len:267 (+) Transcript_45607:1004-1804(+)